MSNLIKTEQPSILRDTDSNALINNNITQYEVYRAGRAKSLQVDQLAKEVDNVKSDIKDIKALLIQLVSKEK
jgi:hypothetical protein